MPRIRSLKPEFFDDEELCQLKPLARLLFAGLWCWADREGRLKDQPTRLKNSILGYDKADGNRLLSDLAGANMIIRYEVEGTGYIQIRHFLRHQRPHLKEVPSTYPEPPSTPTQNGEEHPPRSVHCPPEGKGTDPDPDPEGEIQKGREQRFAVPPPPPGNALRDLYYRHFGHEATQQQRDELETFIALHGQPCVDWVLTEVGGAAIEKRTWRIAKFKFKDCEAEGHGPRENVGASSGGRGVRQGNGRHIGASQRVAGVGEDWDAAERRFNRDVDGEDSRIARPAAAEVADNV